MKSHSIDDKILLTVTATAILALLPALISSIRTHDNLGIIINLIVILGIGSIFSGVWYTSKTKFFSGLLVFFLHITVLTAIYIQGESLIFWLFPIIISSFYLLPTVTANLLNALLIIIALFITYQQFDSFTLPRVIGALILTNIFSLAFSMFMESKNRQLSAKDKVSQLRNSTLELIASSSKLSTILHSVIHNVEHAYPEAICSILLLDKSGKNLVLGAAPSLPDFYNEAIEGVTIGYGMGSCGTAVFTKKRVIVSDISTHPYWANWAELAKKAQLGACWSEPIINDKGEALGVFAIYHREISTPKDIDFSLIEQVSNLVCIAIERDKVDSIIWQQANFDNLTQLPNRNLLLEHLAAALDNAKRERKQLAIAMLDIDNFKDVNDSLGHSAGDSLLIESAKRIKSCLRKNDIVARLGGDEFIVVLVGTATAIDVDKVGQKLLSTLSQPYIIDGQSIHCTASIGVALYPDDAMSIDALLTNADQAMYSAKTRGRNNINYFTENMRTELLKRMEIIQDLRIAITQQQFHMVYQPIVNLENHNIAKAEALIRWQHPEKGLIPPADFIPIAEEAGLITEISEWIFNQVSRQVKHWRLTYCQDLMISINTSPVQYRNQGKQIIAWTESLKAQNISPQAIAFEITENLLMENQTAVVNVLDKVRQQGIAVSIDDFGTGYCSFSYLKNYAIDYLKIDKSFVQNMSANNKDAALCEAIIVMASKLNIDVIAEGIETEQQQKFLAEAGCLFGQGYLLSRPLTKDNFEQLLIKQNSKISPESKLTT
ncbi:EAL domain-containing protein [Colwellia sp. MB3u-4]|uniref:EAL domain-containing protein n=1 Tax=Colwellia sp. MB3u-4 TaxID=2759822 RepID=UPI001C7134E2|nr:EAL domain-containing protein [Colwellia sp. MB3u-4]